MGKTIYNELTPLEKEQQLIYLDSPEPYIIYAIIGITNQQTVFDDMFIKVGTDGNVNDEMVRGHILDKAKASELLDLEKVDTYIYSRDENTLTIVMEVMPIIICLFILSLIIMVRKKQLNNARTKVKYIVGASRGQIKVEGFLESVFLSIVSIILAIICHQILLHKFYLTMFKPKSIFMVYCLSFLITTSILIIITLLANRKIRFTEIERIGG